MTKNNLWSEKSRRSKTILEYEGGAEKLLQYADAHPSERELAQLKIKAELRRWRIELRPPTIGEIQNRYNFTAEYARRFLNNLEKARNSQEKKQTAKALKQVRQTLVSATQAYTENVDRSLVGKKVAENERAQLEAILLDIRGRYAAEIRSRGEQTTVKQGFIYLVKNPCFTGWIKAGMTIDFELRLGTYNTSDPLSRFEYVKLAWTQDRRISERALLKALQLNSEETQGEWFRIRIQDAIFIFDQCRANS